MVRCLMISDTTTVENNQIQWTAFNNNTLLLLLFQFPSSQESCRDLESTGWQVETRVSAWHTQRSPHNPALPTWWWALTLRRHPIATIRHHRTNKSFKTVTRSSVRKTHRQENGAPRGCGGTLVLTGGTINSIDTHPDHHTASPEPIYDVDSWLV